MNADRKAVISESPIKVPSILRDFFPVTVAVAAACPLAMVRVGTRFRDGDFIPAAVMPGDAFPGPGRHDRDLGAFDRGGRRNTARQMLQRILNSLLEGSLRLYRQGKRARCPENDMRGE